MCQSGFLPVFNFVENPHPNRWIFAKLPEVWKFPCGKNFFFSSSSTNTDCRVSRIVLASHLILRTPKYIRSRVYVRTVRRKRGNLPVVLQNPLHTHRSRFWLWIVALEDDPFPPWLLSRSGQQNFWRVRR